MGGPGKAAEVKRTVRVEARDRDVFYTGGLLPGGAYLLPRDRDTNVLEAIAMAGGSIGGGLGSAGRSGATFGGGGIGATLFTAFQRFDYDFVLTIVLAIIAIVMVGEILSGWMRRLFQ